MIQINTFAYSLRLLSCLSSVAGYTYLENNNQGSIQVSISTTGEADVDLSREFDLAVPFSSGKFSLMLGELIW
jgi:hypothetical protein